MPKPVGKCKALNDTSNNTGYGLKVNSYQFFFVPKQTSLPFSFFHYRHTTKSYWAVEVHTFNSST